MHLQKDIIGVSARLEMKHNEPDVEDVPDDDEDDANAEREYEKKRQEMAYKNQLMTEAKAEIGKLRELSEAIDREIPLIYDDEHVVKHI